MWSSGLHFQTVPHTWCLDTGEVPAQGPHRRQLGQFRVLPQPRSKRQSPPHLLAVFKLLEQCMSSATFLSHVCCIILKGQPFQQNECSAV